MSEKASKQRLPIKITGIVMAIIVTLSSVLSSAGIYAISPSTSGSVYCGQEEHTHTSECEEQVLICTLKEGEGHTHSDSCYESQKVLTCTRTEHVHTEDCYDEDGNLTCTSSEHTHGDSCYETQKTLICTLEETEGHTHTDSCYETKIICGKEEHEHSLECYSNPEADVESSSDWEKDFEDLELTGQYGEDLVTIARTQLNQKESEANYVVETE